jgi:hypothetical protein
VRFDVHGRKHDISDHRLVIEQVELLKNHSHVASVNVYVNFHVGNVDALKYDRSACGVLHAVQAAQESTFPASGRAYDSDFFAFVDGSGDAFEHFKLSVAFS